MSQDIKPITFLQPEEMTDDQLRWFVKRFTGVPFFFRIHSESLPYAVGMNASGDEYVVHYNEREDVEDYMKRNFEEFRYAFEQDESVFWSRRMLIYMVVPDWEYYAEKDYSRQYPERNGQVIDQIRSLHSVSYVEEESELLEHLRGI